MQEFGNYRVIKKLGEGATSDVYLGENSLGERRALKVFNHFIPQKQADLAFNRELQNLGKLKNDKIVGVFGLEKSDFGKWVLVQEYIDGMSLSEVLKIEVPPLDRVIMALVIATEVLYALEEAHSKGIIHRDVKPENILLDKNGRVVLSDFGLSKNLNVDQESLHGNLFGSPQYMSLKQFGSAPPTEEVDIYAVAVLMYEIVSGKTPFPGGSIEEVITAKKNGKFKPLYKMNRFTPSRLSSLISSLLSEEQGGQSFDKAYRLRFELLDIFMGFNIDIASSTQLICLGQRIFTSKDEDRFTEILLRDLEKLFDESKDELEKALLLGRISKIDPANHRTELKKKGEWSVGLFLLLIFLSALGLFWAGERRDEAEQGLKSQTDQGPQEKSEKFVTTQLSRIQSLKKELDRPLEVREVRGGKSPVMKEGFLIVNIPSDIRVFVSGKRVLKLGERVPFPAGQHEVALKKEGYRTLNYEIDIQPTKDTVINLD